MSEQEFDNETAAVEAPPEVKPEKTRKPRRTKAEKAVEAAAEETAQVAVETPAEEAVQQAEAQAVQPEEQHADEAAEAPQGPRPQRRDQTLAAETLDIRMLKRSSFPI